MGPIFTISTLDVSIVHFKSNFQLVSNFKSFSTIKLFIDFDPEEFCEDGEVSIPVELVLSETLFEHPLARGRKVYKYLSPLLIQVKDHS